MELLEAVNNILPYFGEAPVTRVDNKHPTVAMIMTVMDSVRMNTLSKGWWCNTAKVKLYPSTEGDMPAPNNALVIQGLKGVNVEARGRKLYNLDTGSYLFDKPIEVKIFRNVDFEDLPRSLAWYIQCRTATQAYAKDYGVEEVLQEMQLREAEALSLVQARHLRKKKYSTVKSTAGLKYMGALRG